jgi:serine/threonine protein kinase
LNSQDFTAQNPVTKAERRVRLYTTAGSNSHDREVTRQAALRESVILEGLDHPGIVKALEFKDHELGPAIVFRRDPEEVRLDHYLAQYGNKLTLDQRLDFVRQLGEALKYAHGRRIIHRALTPRSVLVASPFGPNPQLRIINWQLGRATTTSAPTAGVRSATLHPGQIAEGTHLVYLAPEALLDPRERGETMDVFSLGAISFHIFANKPPAPSLPERDQLLSDQQGYLLSSVLDGVAPELLELIQDATRPDVLLRTETIADFLAGLDAYEERITSPDQDATIHVLSAKAGDTLENGLRVKQRLGGGSAAVALLVEKGDKDLVLKVSRKTEDNHRILAEHSILTRPELRHQRIVAAEPEPILIDGLAGFLMERAGTETLAQRLQREGRLSLDLLQRFGEDLLEAAEHLEAVGIAHRDLKPDNIGISEYGKNRELRLKIFDFSLSNSPADSIRAGTPPYLEPFLVTKERGQKWDTAAERFSIAMMLHEMATGTLPFWGDRNSAPHLIRAEVTVEGDLIDAPIREALTEFFQRALRRDPKARYDNAGEMRNAWHSAFAIAAATDSKIPDPSALASAIETVTRETYIRELPISTRAKNALDRIEAYTVTTLLRQAPRSLFHLKGVGNKTREEILDLVRQLRSKFPENVLPEQLSVPEDDEAVGTDGQYRSVDSIVPLLVPGGRYSKDQPHRDRMLALLELIDGLTDGPTFPSQTDIAKHAGKTRALIGQDLMKARQRWRKTPPLTEVRREVAEFLDAQGGIATIGELTQFVLSARGSEAEDPHLRLRRAGAVLRAALEAERAADEPRWLESRAHDLFLVALTGDGKAADLLFQFAWQLGEAAKKIADADPLPSPARALELLRLVRPCPTELSDNRLLKLASSAAAVSLSPRLELYPAGMSALRALKLAQTGLAGLDRLSVEDVQRRVRDRYPDAEALPSRPILDELLRESGLALTWNTAEQVYRAPRMEIVDPSSTIHRAVTQYSSSRPLPPAIDLPKEIQDARDLERRLQASLENPSYLVLFTAPRYLRRAADELQRRFALDVVNLEAELIQTMQAQATALGAQWPVVRTADAQGKESQDWLRLKLLVERSLPVIETKLRNRARPVLLLYPGLLARYEQMSVLARFADSTAQHSLWVLVGSDQNHTLDGASVPARGGNQVAELTKAWVENRHRSLDGGAAA